jgi:putative ABC transport system permease protein
MFRTYWLTALRYLNKHKLYAAINIAGLSIGLASCLLIIVYLRNEFRYDTFHANKDRIVRATMEYQMAGTVNKVATSGTKLGPQAKRTFPGVESFVRLYQSTKIVEHKDRTFEEKGFLYADKDFFKVFSFKLLAGNPETVLSEPDNVVLTRDLAIKYFGTSQVVGNTLKMGDNIYKVSGVCENPPQYSQIKFDLVTDFMNLGEGVTREQWWTANWLTYFLLSPGTEVKAFQQQLDDYMKTTDVRAQVGAEGSDFLRYNLEPLLNVHLYSEHAGMEPNGNIRYMYMFGMVALLILIIAAANYTNLATAQAAGRAAEMGMRKAIGATRKDLFWQFIGESTVIALLSGVLSLLLAWFFLPALNAITLRNFSEFDLFHPIPVSLLFALLLGLGFLSGAYPAIVLSGMRTLQVMKRSFSLNQRNLLVRRTLIVGQFSISVFLIIYTLIMVQQMQFMQSKNIGFQKEQMIVLPVDSKMREGYEILKESLATLPGVKAVSGANETPEFVQWGDGVTAFDDRGQHNVSVSAMPVDIGFLETMGMELLAGKDFSKADLTVEDYANSEEASSEAFILNESLAKKIGWTPEQAIGKSVSKHVDGKVVGVVKDFHFQSMHTEVGPMLMFLEPKFVRQMVVKLDGNNMKENMARLEGWWKQRVTHRSFSYRFIDESYAKLYEGEQRALWLFFAVSFIAMFLACLGLFGLASFMVLQRTREIGIRKVLGAGIPSIVWMVAKHFLLLVFIGILIAVPVGWMAGTEWLNGFAYRVSPGFWVFLLSGVSALSIAFLTICVQTVRAALINPVKSLRTD